MADVETIRKYAQQRAQECIEDWAHECWHENNECWGTDFTDDEMNAIVDLAARAVAVLPDA